MASKKYPFKDKYVSISLSSDCSSTFWSKKEVIDTINNNFNLAIEDTLNENNNDILDIESYLCDNPLFINLINDLSYNCVGFNSDGEFFDGMTMNQVVDLELPSFFSYSKTEEFFNNATEKMLGDDEIIVLNDLKQVKIGCQSYSFDEIDKAIKYINKERGIK